MALNLAWVLVWGVGKAEERIAGRIRRKAGRVLQRAEPRLASCPGWPGSQKGKEDMAGPCCHHLPTGRIPHLNGTRYIKGRHARPWVPVCCTTPRRGSAERASHGPGSPAHPSLPRPAGLTGSFHVCASRAAGGGRAVGSQTEGFGTVCLSAGREELQVPGPRWLGVAGSG